MAIFEIKERRLIPNWRDFKRTVQLGELYVANSNIVKAKIEVGNEVTDWINQKNMGTAADMINASYIAGITDLPETLSAAQFILNNPQSSSESLVELTKQILSRTEELVDKHFVSNILETDYETLEDFQSLINSKVLYRLINRTRNKAREEVYNPINWIELARLYSINGQSEQAEPSILTALHLAPDNRFILRSATRYFIHNGNFEKALYYLKKSKSLKTDPWLISAHIATSSLMDRYSPFIKTGLSLTDSAKYTDFDLTELAGSLGTLEFKSGAFKSAKKLFEKSMLSPNDNSLAQMEWISKDDARFKINLAEFNEVINPFEAYAIDKYEKGEWKESFYHCLKWFSDTPFSKRPILLGCYLAGSLLNDYESAITLCKIGLQANPSNIILLNNIIYYLALSGKLDEIGTYVNRINSTNFDELPSNVKPVLQATIGLVNFKTGKIQEGKMLYELSIANSEKLKNPYLKNAAILNYTRELILSRQEERFKYMEIVRNMTVKNVHNDQEYIKSQILKLGDV